MAKLANRDPVITSFVRGRLAKLYDNGHGIELKEIARRGGLTASHLSQVLSGDLGVGGKTLPKYAVALGYKDGDTLREVAQEWWLAERKKQPKKLTAAMVAARDEVLATGAAAEDEVADIIDALSHERFRGRPREWWRFMIFSELRETNPEPPKKTTGGSR